MIKSKTAIFLDTLFICVILDLTIFVWVNKLLKNAILCVFILNIISILLFCLIFLRFLKKHNLLKIKNSEVKKLDNILNDLAFLPDKNYSSFFENLLNVKHIDGYIFVNTKAYFYINTKTTLDATDFLYSNNYYKSLNTNKPLCFIGTDFNDKFNNLISSSPTKYLCFKSSELLPILKDTNLLNNYTPENNTNLKLKIKSKIPLILSRKNFKNYFFSGLSLITFSLFIPYSIYYLLIGTFLLILSLATLFSKKQINNESKKSLSDLIKNWCYLHQFFVFINL